MKTLNQIALLKTSAAPLALGFALIATPAAAQQSVLTATQAEDQSDETNQEVGIQAVPDATDGQQTAEGPAIVVTGSRIARRELESAAPIAVVQDEEFKLSGTVNVENVLNTLPQVIPGTTSFSNNPGGGVATLNLRGLGAERTLVLVNNRRYMFYDTTQIVDLNTIPAFLIDSVDVVTGGASAVYGSDAVSGVVNFRLRQDLVGVEVGGQYSITERGDGARYNAYLALGTELGDGRGHATVYGEYYRRKSVFGGDRDFSSPIFGGEAFGLPFGPSGSSTLPQGRFNTNGTALVRNGFNPDNNLDADGNPDYTDPGDIAPITRDLGVGGVFDDAVFDVPGVARPRAGDLYNFAPANYLQVPQERYLLGGYGEYELSDAGHKAYTEVTFVNNRVANELAATPVTGTFNINIAAVSPFLNAAAIADLQRIDANETAINAERAAINAANVDTPGFTPLGPLYSGANAAANGPGVISTSIQRRTTDVGSRNQLDERNAFRLLAGVTGPVFGNFNYDAYYSYARTRNAQVQNGNISRSAFQAGLDGSGTPINIFGPNTLTPAQVDAISILAQNGDTSVLQVASASLAGGLFNLGFGADDVGIAVGGEYRKVASEFIPDTALSSGDVIGFNAGQPTAGSYNVKEVFGELRIPIATGRPGLELLEATGAVRYSDYSLDAVGGVTTYAGGLQYAPIRDITFRGQYQKAIRAPNVGELFGGQAQGFPGATDPCANPDNVGNATIRALCLATGVSAAAFGTEDLQPNAQIQGLFGGNPNLQEERSESYTAGVVLRPRFLPGFALTADFFNIKIENTISVLGGGLNNTLNLCYNVIQDVNSIYCQVIAAGRNQAAGGVIDDTNPPAILNANVGKLESQGIDLGASYNARLPFSLLTDTGEQRLNLFFQGTYTDKSNSTPVATLPDIVDECAGKFGTLACGNPTPKYKWTSRASFIDGPLTTSIRWRHLSSVRDDNDALDYFVERIGAYNLVDLSFAADLTDAFTLAIGVNNLFDKAPRVLGDNQQQSNTYPSTYDVLGRDFFVSAALRF